MPAEDTAAETPETRFESTEAYYAEYRPEYGDRAMQYLVNRFDLDGSSRVLDLGCGAGQIAVPLAAHVGEVVGMDPNEAMLEYARERAAAADRENIEWVVGSDADLAAESDTGTGSSLDPDDLAPLTLTTMGRSFHWMDQARTLDLLRTLTESGGGVALVTDPEWLVRGTKEWQDAVYDTVTGFLDDVPERTGPVSYDDDPWDELIEEHGFADVETEVIEFEREWGAESVVGYVLSLSYCSPDEFGDDQAAFEEELRSRLGERDEERFVQDVTLELVTGRVAETT